MSSQFSEEMTNTRALVKAAGAQAFREGLPCTAPSYGRDDLEALWRIGWKYERARSEQQPTP